MTKLTQHLKTGRFAVLLSSVVLLGVVVGAVIGRSGNVPLVRATQPTQAGLPLVTSATSAVRVVGVQRTSIGENPILDVSLQNISAKNIKAYSVGSGKGWVTRSYFFSEISFAPNAIERQIIPLSSAGFTPASKEFIVTGVLFGDGTTDGQAVSVFRLKETHEGLRDQANRLVPCLRQLPSTLISEHEVALSRCESEARTLSIKGRSSDYEDGLQNAQREFLTQLNEIRDKVRSSNFSGAAQQRDQVIRVFQSLIQPQ